MNRFIPSQGQQPQTLWGQASTLNRGQRHIPSQRRVQNFRLLQTRQGQGQTSFPTQIQGQASVLPQTQGQAPLQSPVTSQNPSQTQMQAQTPKKTPRQIRQRPGQGPLPTQNQGQAPLQSPVTSQSPSQTQMQAQTPMQTQQQIRQGPGQGPLPTQNQGQASLQTAGIGKTKSQIQKLGQRPRSLQTGQDQASRAPTQRRPPRMNDVNMPSGTRVSIVIPSRSTCSCTTVGSNLKLITLKPDGAMSGREYKIVADEMHKTLQAQNYASYSIKQIQKVQNCCLWSKFRAIEKTIANDAGYVNERMLFHGSASADVIVKTGFDLGKAKGGLFGRGVYFAKNSSKSNQYSPGYLGHRRMLFCRVALGRMHKTSTTGVTAAPLGHHSVEGNLAVPEYVVYNADQAYPEYLVYYDISN